MENKDKKKKKIVPINNDQLGENASEEFTDEYSNSGKDCDKQNKTKK
jgi:hypothetical protein